MGTTNFYGLLLKAFPQFHWSEEPTSSRKANLIGERHPPGMLEGVKAKESIRYYESMRAEGHLRITHVLEARVSSETATITEDQAIEQLRAWMPEPAQEHSTTNHFLSLIRVGFFTERQLAALVRTCPDLDGIAKDYILERHPKIKPDLAGDLKSVRQAARKYARSMSGTGQVDLSGHDVKYPSGHRFSTEAHDIGFLEINFIKEPSVNAVSVRWVPWSRVEVRIGRSLFTDENIKGFLLAWCQATEGLFLDDLKRSFEPGDNTVLERLFLHLEMDQMPVAKKKDDKRFVVMPDRTVSRSNGP